MSVHVDRSGAYVDLRCDGIYTPDEDPWGGGRCPQSLQDVFKMKSDPAMATAATRLRAELDHGWRVRNGADYCHLCVRAGRHQTTGRCR